MRFSTLTTLVVLLFATWTSVLEMVEATPTASPTAPTRAPSRSPSKSPTRAPSRSPTKSPTYGPTISPTTQPLCDNTQVLGTGISFCIVAGLTSLWCLIIGTFTSHVKEKASDKRDEEDELKKDGCVIRRLKRFTAWSDKFCDEHELFVILFNVVRWLASIGLFSATMILYFEPYNGLCDSPGSATQRSINDDNPGRSVVVASIAFMILEVLMEFWAKTQDYHFKSPVGLVVTPVQNVLKRKGVKG